MGASNGWWNDLFQGLALDCWEQAVPEQQTQTEADFLLRAAPLAWSRRTGMPCSRSGVLPGQNPRSKIHPCWDFGSFDAITGTASSDRVGGPLPVAGTVGVVSPSGNEVGPFLSVEHAALSQSVPGERRTAVFAWHNLVGSLATALGSLGGGVASQLLQAGGVRGADSYRPVVIAYGVAGLVLAVLFSRLSPAAEVFVA